MKKKSSLMLLLCLVLIFNSVIVYGVTFTDVSKENWAYDYIVDMEEKDIIKGYSDGTFQPNQSVSKIASVVLVYRVLLQLDHVDKEDLEKHLETYEFVLKKYEIPDWAEDSVAFFLGEELLVEDELKYFVDKDGRYNKATKGEVSIYLGRSIEFALDLDLPVKIYSFEFTDSSTIPFSMAPYVDLLVNYKIVNGDDQGNFNTNNPIRRSVISKMLSESYDIIKYEREMDLGGEELSKEIEGYILDFNKLDDNIMIKDKGEFELPNDAIIYIGDYEKDHDELKMGDYISVKVNTKGVIRELEVDLNKTYKGSSIYRVRDYKDDYKLTFETSYGTRRSLKTIDEEYLEVKKDNVDSDGHALEREMIVREIDFNNKNKIESINLMVLKDEYTGVIKKDPIYTIKGFEIELEYDDDEEGIKLSGNSSTDIKKGDKVLEFEDLNANDKVRVIIKGGMIKEVIVID